MGMRGIAEPTDPGWRLLRPRAQQMRRAPTPAEKRLWQFLRRGRLGTRFRRQVAIGPFIVDFYCPAQSLVVEVDGEVHDDHLDVDARRSEILGSMGLHVLRVSNDEVMNAIDLVVQAIVTAMHGGFAGCAVPRSSKRVPQETAKRHDRG